MKYLFSILIFLTSCAPSGPHKPVSEEGPTSGEFSSAGYDSVKPIFAQNCAACHPSRSGPDWLDYTQASAYARNGKLLRRVSQERSMPPPGTPQAAAISESERMALASWARAGGPKEAREGAKPGGKITPEPNPQERLVQNCLRCHGASGPDPSAQPRIPLLAGQNEKYMIKELRKFKWGERVDPTQQMNEVAIDLSEEQIRSAARYFATRNSHAGGQQSLTPRDHRLFERGQALAERDCVSCHRNPEYGNRPTDPELPALSGQSKIYLINQLVYFRGNERSNPLMRELARQLSNDDIEALAVYFANVN